MTKTTIFLLILSVVIAGLLSFYHYIFKAKNKSGIHLFLAFIRFCSIFLILLLLINPKIETKSFETEKTVLPILIDNSSSITGFSSKAEIQKLYSEITKNKTLTEKYDIQLLQFDSEVKALDTLNLKGKQTQIDHAAKTVQQLNRNKNYPIVLLSDGNQTVGSDYVYSFSDRTPVFPIVLGDTTTVFDLKINQINTNKYAFLKNKFPVEVFTQFNGNKSTTAVLNIQEGNKTIYKQNITFSKDKKAQSLSVLLDANSVGVKKYKATLTSNLNEKNTKNNTANFAVEVLDQQSEIAIVSTINHPDLSALKRSIEVNKQRKVSIVKPKDIKSLESFTTLILYQPDATFKSVFELNKTANINTLSITGLSTDFNFLNQNQQDFSFKMNAQQENYLGDFNVDFNSFIIEDIGFSSLPPLENKFGTITAMKNSQTLLYSKIRNVRLEIPLLTFLEEGKLRKAYLFGENIWKWRMESYLDKTSFEEFDVFIDKTIQYLSSNSTKNNLVVNAENFYNSGESIVITAQFFNKNYEIDANAELTIQLTNLETKQTKTYNFSNTNTDFKVYFDGLEKGNYKYVVSEKKSQSKAMGAFEILDFDMEQQFVNPDKTRLEQLASATNGLVFYPNQIDKLIKRLIDDENYIPIQKEVVKKTPLIDWKYLLIFIVFFLSTEWFVRKYNGLV